MRLRTCNKRKARRTRATVVPHRQGSFCYILFEAPYIFINNCGTRGHPDSVMAYSKGHTPHNWRWVDRRFCYDIKEKFDSYADAIVWLTKLKLSLTNKPEKFRLFSMKEIVEGYYTKGNREVVTRRTDLTNVSHSLPTRNERRAAKQRQFRQQRYQRLRHPQIVATTTPTATSTINIWSTGSATGSSTTQTMGGGWHGPSTVSVSDGGTVSWSN